MNNPAYTESLIQEALSALSPLPITIDWDGKEVEDLARYSVSFDLNETDLVVWDDDVTYDIYQRTGPNKYAAVGWALVPEELAAKLIAIIEEDIASGKLGEEA